MLAGIFGGAPDLIEELLPGAGAEMAVQCLPDFGDGLPQFARIAAAFNTRRHRICAGAEQFVRDMIRNGWRPRSLPAPSIDLARPTGTTGPTSDYLAARAAQKGVTA